MSFRYARASARIRFWHFKTRCKVRFFWHTALQVIAVFERVSGIVHPHMTHEVTRRGLVMCDMGLSPSLSEVVNYRPNSSPARNRFLTKPA